MRKMVKLKEKEKKRVERETKRKKNGNERDRRKGGVYVMIVTDCLIVETRGRRWAGV